MRKEDLWFNWAPSSNLMANQAMVSTHPPNTAVATPNVAVALPAQPIGPALPAIPTPHTPAIYTDCTKCAGGGAVGNRVSGGALCSSLGAGWIEADPNRTGTWIDPCVNTTPQHITCYECGLDGQSYASSYPNTLTCPGGTSPNPITNCLPPTITGCTDPSSITYNPLATVDDSSCQYPVVPPIVPVLPTIAPPPDVFGCRDPKANNYDALANLDGEPCDYTITPTAPITPESGKTGGIDDKTLMYIGIGVVALLLLKK